MMPLKKQKRQNAKLPTKEKHLRDCHVLAEEGADKAAQRQCQVFTEVTCRQNPVVIISLKHAGSVLHA